MTFYIWISTIVCLWVSLNHLNAEFWDWKDICLNRQTMETESFTQTSDSQIRMEFYKRRNFFLECIIFVLLPYQPSLPNVNVHFTLIDIWRVLRVDRKFVNSKKQAKFHSWNVLTQLMKKVERPFVLLQISLIIIGRLLRYLEEMCIGWCTRS